MNDIECSSLIDPENEETTNTGDLTPPYLEQKIAQKTRSFNHYRIRCFPRLVVVKPGFDHVFYLRRIYERWRMPPNAWQTVSVLVFSFLSRSQMKLFLCLCAGESGSICSPSFMWLIKRATAFIYFCAASRRGCLLIRVTSNGVFIKHPSDPNRRISWTDSRRISR